MRLFGKGHPAMMAAVTLTTLLLPHAAGAKTFHCAAGDVACLIIRSTRLIRMVAPRIRSNWKEGYIHDYRRQQRC